MKNNYIPEILKEKFSLFFNYLYGFLLLLVSILSALALFSFDINENSFLTSSNKISENLVGNFGSYFASFVFYTFGVLGYMLIIFFLIYSILVFLKKDPNYIFIRMLVFFASLILIPQAPLSFGFEINLKPFDHLDSLNYSKLRSAYKLLLRLLMLLSFLVINKLCLFFSYQGLLFIFILFFKSVIIFS